MLTLLCETLSKFFQNYNSDYVPLFCAHVNEFVVVGRDKSGQRMADEHQRGHTGHGRCRTAREATEIESVDLKVL
jgi:hypothetical protein